MGVYKLPNVFKLKFYGSSFLQHPGDILADTPDMRDIIARMSRVSGVSDDFFPFSLPRAYL